MTYDTEKRNDWALNQQADVSIQQKEKTVRQPTTKQQLLQTVQRTEIH